MKEPGTHSGLGFQEPGITLPFYHNPFKETEPYSGLQNDKWEAIDHAEKEASKRCGVNPTLEHAFWGYYRAQCYTIEHINI